MKLFVSIILITTENLKKKCKTIYRNKNLTRAFFDSSFCGFAFKKIHTIMAINHKIQKYLTHLRYFWFQLLFIWCFYSLLFVHTDSSKFKKKIIEISEVFFFVLPYKIKTFKTKKYTKKKEQFIVPYQLSWKVIPVFRSALDIGENDSSCFNL